MYPFTRREAFDTNIPAYLGIYSCDLYWIPVCSNLGGHSILYLATALSGHCPKASVFGWLFLASNQQRLKTKPIILKFSGSINPAESKHMPAESSHNLYKKRSERIRSIRLICSSTDSWALCIHEMLLPLLFRAYPQPQKTTDASTCLPQWSHSIGQTTQHVWLLRHTWQAAVRIMPQQAKSSDRVTYFLGEGNSYNYRSRDSEGER